MDRMAKTYDDGIDLMAVCTALQEQFKTATVQTIARLQAEYRRVTDKIRRRARKEKAG